jgi:hypothetical protein
LKETLDDEVLERPGGLKFCPKNTDLLDHRGRNRLIRGVNDGMTFDWLEMRFHCFAIFMDVISQRHSEPHFRAISSTEDRYKDLRCADTS